MYNNSKPKRFKKGFFIFLFVLAGIFGLTAIVMTLWNAILPDLIHVEHLSYWHAMGLLALCKILFGGFRFGGGGYRNGSNRWKGKFMNMSPEEKEAFKEKMKERCYNKE